MPKSLAIEGLQLQPFFLEISLSLTPFHHAVKSWKGERTTQLGAIQRLERKWEIIRWQCFAPLGLTWLLFCEQKDFICGGDFCYVTSQAVAVVKC